MPLPLWFVKRTFEQCPRVHASKLDDNLILKANKKSSNAWNQ